MKSILTRLFESFDAFGDSVIRNAPSILIGLVVLAIFIFAALWLRNLTRRRLKKRIDDILLANFIGRIVFLLIIAIGGVIFLNQLGLGKAAGGLLAGAGVSAIIIGLAFKDIGENFLAGFFLAFSRPFAIGDTIEVEKFKGIVKALNFRNTHIRTLDGRDIFLPNSLLIKSPLSNFTRDGLLRYDFLVGLDYGDDIGKAGALIIQTLEFEQNIEHVGELKPQILIDSFGTSTINMKVFYWVNSNRYTGPISHLQTSVMNQVLLNLKNGGFNLPADIIELKIYQEGKPIPVAVMNAEGKKA